MIKNITIKPTATVKEAMKALDLTAEKVLLVVDKNKRLLGTLTDGDIRRYILSGQDLKGTIEKAYNPKPTYMLQGQFNLETVKKVLTQKKIDLIPILDKEQKVIDFITWEKAFGNGNKRPKKKMDVPTVIMAGGKGSRLDPFTKVLPKPLIPVNGQPIIDHIIDRFVDYGVKRFWLTVNYKSRILKAYFEEKGPRYSVKFVDEKSPLGTVASLKYLEGKFNKPFFVTNCDIIIKTNYSDLYESHQKGSYDLTLVASMKHYVIPYGTCELNGDGHLKHIHEKPEYNFLVNTGLYVINPELLSLIPDGKIYHITQLIEDANQQGKRVGVYPIGEEAWIDVGQWAEYRKAAEQL